MGLLNTRKLAKLVTELRSNRRKFVFLYVASLCQ